MPSKFSVAVKIRLLAVNLLMKWLNFWLEFFRKILFCKKISNPRNILIYKVGNIGDVVCAIPALIAIRRNYPGAKITLLTSPGKENAPGAKDFLQGAWYLDEIKIYYDKDIDSAFKTLAIAKDLRKNNYDLFIQLPDDWAKFRTLLRNMIFAKLIGAKTAFGFYLRSSWIFRKAQIDYSPLYCNEVKELLFLLKRSGIKVGEAEFDFPITRGIEEKAESLLKDFKIKDGELLIGFGPGAKFSSKEWPLEKFIEVGKYLSEKYDAKFAVFGGPKDAEKGDEIEKKLGKDRVLNLAGKLSILETLVVLKRAKFLLSNDTGTVHLAAAVNVPCVALYSIRSPFGKWFPYGQGHKMVYHRFIDCDYREESCVKKSIESITFDEVARACEDIIKIAGPTKR